MTHFHKHRLVIYNSALPRIQKRGETDVGRPSPVFYSCMVFHTVLAAADLMNMIRSRFITHHFFPYAYCIFHAVRAVVSGVSYIKNNSYAFKAKFLVKGISESYYFRRCESEKSVRVIFSVGICMNIFYSGICCFRKL